MFLGTNVIDCPQHCSLCWNATDCYECTHGYFLDDTGLCQRMYTIFTYYLMFVTVIYLFILSIISCMQNYLNYYF